ncbi:MAG: helix-turn-helix transcriptional regulator [Mogibacterium sp.]|nr:helix-turn-helix transcriptional regulator [Mogibacterium sp.]
MDKVKQDSSTGSKADINAAIGERIRFYRKKKGLTIVEMAQRMHISKSALSKYERGEVSITLDAVNELAKVLDLDPFQLLDDSSGTHDRSLFHTPTEYEPDYDKYYAYSYTGHGKAYLCKHVLLVGKTTGHLYAEITDEQNYRNCKYFYTGEVFSDSSKQRVYLVNHMHREDIIIIEYSKPLGTAPLQYAFCVSLSIGVNYPIACRWLLSKTVISNNKQLENLLTLTNANLKRYREAGGFFVDEKALITLNGESQ